MIEKIKAGLAAVKGAIDNAVGAATDWVADKAGAAWTTITGIASDVTQWVGDKLGLVKNDVEIIDDVVKDDIDPKKDSIFKDIDDVEDTVTIDVKDMTSRLADEVEDTNKELADYLRDFYGGAEGDMYITYDKIDNNLTNKTEDSKGIIDTIKDYLTGGLSSVVNGVGNVLSGIGTTIGNAFSAAIEWIWSQLKAGYAYIRDLIFSAGEALMVLPEKLTGLGDLMNGYFNISPEKFVESAMESMEGWRLLQERLQRGSE